MDELLKLKTILMAYSKILKNMVPIMYYVKT